MTREWSQRVVDDHDPLQDADDLDAQDIQVLLIEYQNMQNEKRYIYLAVPEDLHDPFMRARAEGGFSYAEYGEILAMGDGQPTQELRLKMERLYQITKLS